MSQSLLIAILAAGQSRRFGSDKLAANFKGLPLGEYVHRLARSMGHPVIWITGDRGHWTPDDCEVVDNANASQGMGTSVALAAQMARERGVDALMILLADMPMVQAATLESMITHSAPVCCRYPDGNAGPPALLPSTLFETLEKLRGDTGAKAVLRAVPDIAFIAPESGELFDIDTHADLHGVM